MSKYYTPELEEFHVGFEYERFIPKTNVREDECWEKLTMSVNYLTLDKIDDEIIEKEIRVKHLDSEDIESLGFSKKITSHAQRDVRLWFGSLVYCGGLEKGHLIYYISYYEEDNHLIIRLDNLDTEDNDITIFNGNIKNKSELIKLLKQLNIK